MTTDHPIFFAIARDARNDGAPIRTTLFFKGCGLRCSWCRSPEGRAAGLEVVTVADRCIGCRECIDGCPEAALALGSRGIVRDPDRCTLHLNCVEICPSLAHEALGWSSSVAAMMAEIEKDRPFYGTSGGVVFAGGEPLSQAGHLIALLKRCGDREIHRTVDTCGYADGATLLEVAEHTDHFLFEIKHMDTKRHRRLTGAGNELILNNLRSLDAGGASVRVRYPLIKTINDDMPNVEAMGRFLSGLHHINEIDLLIFPSPAGASHSKPDRSTAASLAPSAETVAATAEILEHYGLSVNIER